MQIWVENTHVVLLKHNNLVEDNDIKLPKLKLIEKVKNLVMMR